MTAQWRKAKASVTVENNVLSFFFFYSLSVLDG
jgi:hypothetical protein